MAPHRLLDFEATGIIESWLPLFVFSITFGISMDYLTFAIGRKSRAIRVFGSHGHLG